jgi:hypothetical protein
MIPAGLCALWRNPIYPAVCLVGTGGYYSGSVYLMDIDDVKVGNMVEAKLQISGQVVQGKVTLVSRGIGGTQSIHVQTETHGYLTFLNTEIVRVLSERLTMKIPPCTIAVPVGVVLVGLLYWVMKDKRYGIIWCIVALLLVILLVAWLCLGCKKARSSVEVEGEQ